MSEETKYDKLLGIISQMQMIKSRIDRRAQVLEALYDDTPRQKIFFDWVVLLESAGALSSRDAMVGAVSGVLTGEQIDDMAKLDVLLRDVVKGGWNE